LRHQERAAQIAIKTVTDFLKQQSVITEVIFVCFDQENYEIMFRQINNNSAD
jgi:O-acetyl-ADP-ribose deacetylase (regulator of RNase III)